MTRKQQDPAFRASSFGFLWSFGFRHSGEVWLAPRPLPNLSTKSMFTGIVEEAVRIEAVRPTPRSIELTVRVGVCGRGLKVGDSLAINGFCLTVTKLSMRGKTRLAGFDLLKETWRRTNLQLSKPGSLDNLNSHFREDGRFGGAFSTG